MASASTFLLLSERTTGACGTVSEAVVTPGWLFVGRSAGDAASSDERSAWGASVVAFNDRTGTTSTRASSASEERNQSVETGLFRPGMGVCYSNARTQRNRASIRRTRLPPADDVRSGRKQPPLNKDCKPIQQRGQVRESLPSGASHEKIPLPISDQTRPNSLGQNQVAFQNHRLPGLPSLEKTPEIRPAPKSPRTGRFRAARRRHRGRSGRGRADQLPGRRWRGAGVRPARRRPRLPRRPPR